MAIHTFELLFDPPKWKPEPDSARAHIGLSSWGKEKDWIVVSPECRTEGEVEATVKRLKKDLDRVLSVARRKFAKARQR